jgi:membrane-associated phospholipid phosphatase
MCFNNPANNIKSIKKIFFILFVIVSHTTSFSDSAFLRWGDYLENDLDQSFKLVHAKSLLSCLGITGGIYFISRCDSQWNQSIQQVYHGRFKIFLNITNELGSVLYTLPAATIIAAGALNTRSEKFQDAAFTSLASILISDGIVAFLKILSGRSRPQEGKGPYYFKPLSGRISFPSAHTASAFALLTPWILYYPNAFTYSLFILPVGTGLARMAKNQHWASDVVTGSIIGFAVAYFLTEWHKDKRKEKAREVREPSGNRIYRLNVQFPL